MVHIVRPSPPIAKIPEGDPLVTLRRATERHPEPPRRLSSAATVLSVFEFVGGEKSRPLPDIIRHLRRPKSTVLRLLDTLVRSGFIRRVAPGEYAVTLKAWRVGSQALASLDLQTTIDPVVRSVARQTGESALFAVYEDGHAVYVDKADSSMPVASFVKIGTRAPAYATATGKTLLAHQPEAEVERVLKNLRRCTPTTITNAGALRRALEDIREQKLAFSNGEWREEVAGAAAPVFDRSGALVGAVGVTCPRNRAQERLQNLGAIVRSVAGDLSERLGAPAGILHAFAKLTHPQERKVRRRA